jgi:hypothetical protein
MPEINLVEDSISIVDLLVSVLRFNQRSDSKKIDRSGWSEK